ncbi:MAG: aminotransferase class I/II-fold pyridoxal phosphate-dependent enzyme, partial [Mailhella sp.]|nr:aminotransferase class I/II-fold pyridoxal phosphate-dependent enzyme [Mailhella sp.]
NNIYSLSLAKDYLLKEDTILLESDLIFEDSALDCLIADPRDTLALVDKYESWMDGTCVKLSDQDDIEAFVPGSKFRFEDISSYYKTVNIYKFSKGFSATHYVPFLEAYQKALGLNEYYEQVLRVIAMLDHPAIKAKRLDGQLWYEIDDVQDLDIASSMFAPDGDDKLALLQNRYGGYWRYPHLVDFCYLVTPYYPPQKMLDEIKASFEKLLAQYPSGMQVNSLLAAKNFSVQPRNIIVGNGAAELIKALLESLDGVMGFVSPTFEEYPNRYPKERSVVFRVQTEGFRYGADDLIRFFDGKAINALAVVNPDNPSGNYIPRADMLRLVDWARGKGIRLVIDESFVDFADEKDATLIEEGLLEANPHLFVMKSISKSYGVPGLRLGVLASGDTAMIADMKKKVAIWNINSFAEFYMQIAEKYKKSYAASLELLRAERGRFMEEMSKTKGLRVYPSQANYVLAKLECGVSAKELTRRLLLEHSLFVKDLTKKCHEDYLRFAIRDSGDNQKLLNALWQILGEGDAA